MITAELKGTENLIKNLKLLAKDVQLKTAKAAARKAANVIRDAARENALAIDDSSTTESIAKNITVRASGKSFARTGDVTFKIGVMGGADGRRKPSNDNNPGGDTGYWRHIEFGTNKTPAKPFMLPALRDNIQNATDTFAEELNKGIDKAVSKMRKQ